MAAWQVNAAEFSGAKMIMTTPDGEMAFELPTTGFPVNDYTSYGQASSLVVNSFEVFLNDADQTNVSDVTLHVAMYKQGYQPEDHWIDLPLNYIAGGSWGMDIDKDLAEEAGDGGNFVLELYVTANNNGNQLTLNNGGQNYIVMFALAGGGGGETYDNVKWLTTGTAEIILYTEGNYPQYRYDGDGTRDNTDMPGSCDMLGINYFSIKYDLAENTQIVDASLQYKIITEGGEDSGWNRIDCNELSTLVSSRHNTYRSSMNEPRLVSRDLEPGNYTLRIMYQLIDQEGKYYFFGRDNDNFVFHFSINEPPEPEITGISMVMTPTPGEQQYPWLEAGETYDPIDLVKDEPLTSLTIDEVYLFAQGRFNYIELKCRMKATNGDMLYGIDIPVTLDDFGNWSNEESNEVLWGDMLENGKIYTLYFWADGEDNDGNIHVLDNNGEKYQVVFTYGDGGSGTPGDLNGDGNVNTGDISALYSALLEGATDSMYDINGDGNVNTGDVSALYQIILGQ